MAMEKHSKKMEKNAKKSEVLKLVYPLGVVEIHKKPITAAEVMRKNPRHCVTRPDVFRYPWIVVRPEAVLKPGNVFFVVPCHTIHRLLQKFKQKNQEQVAAFHFQEEDFRSRDKKDSELDIWADQELKCGENGSSRLRTEGCLLESPEKRTQVDKKASMFGFLADRGLEGGAKTRSSFGSEGHLFESPDKGTQGDKKASQSELWAHQEDKSGMWSPFSFGKRGSLGESPVETTHFHELLKHHYPDLSTGRAKVDCKFEDDGQDAGIFPESLVACRNKQYFDPWIDKPPFIKPSCEAMFPRYHHESPRNLFAIEKWLKRFNDIIRQGHSRKQTSGFEIYESPGKLYHKQRPLFSFSISPGETEGGGSLPRDDERLKISNDQEVDRITLKSCLKKDNLRKGVRVKFSLPGEDEEKLRAEVFEFEPTESPPYSP